jgi:tetratricopeptide (TPR) repeat protein
VKITYPVRESKSTTLMTLRQHIELAGVSAEPTKGENFRQTARRETATVATAKMINGRMEERTMKHTLRQLNGRILRLVRISACVYLAIAAAQGIAGGQGGQGGMTVSGTVWLPDGSPAQRVRVRITGRTGVSIDVNTDASGKYSQQLPLGRYSLTATNPRDPEQFTDPVEAEGTRFNPHVIAQLFLLRPATVDKTRGGGSVVSVAEATQRIPKDARTEFEEGIKHRKKKQHDKALARLTRAIELFPAYYQALVERGELQVNMQRFAEAAQDFDTAIELNKGYERALRGAGFCRLQQQKYTEAIEFFEQAILIDPNVAQSHLFLGVARLAVGRYEQARPALVEALRLDRDGAVSAHIYLANLDTSEKRYKDAANHLKAYLEARPDAPDAPRLKQREAELRALAKNQ